MNYLVTVKGEEPFYTDWFDSKNFFNHEIGMVIYNLYDKTYTVDGENWNAILFDSL